MGQIYTDGFGWFQCSSLKRHKLCHIISCRDSGRIFMTPSLKNFTHPHHVSPNSHPLFSINVSVSLGFAGLAGSWSKQKNIPLLKQKKHQMAGLSAYWLYINWSNSSKHPRHLTVKPNHQTTNVANQTLPRLQPAMARCWLGSWTHRKQRPSPWRTFVLSLFLEKKNSWFSDIWDTYMVHMYKYIYGISHIYIYMYIKKIYICGTYIWDIPCIYIYIFISYGISNMGDIDLGYQATHLLRVPSLKLTVHPWK